MIITLLNNIKLEIEEDISERLNSGEEILIGNVTVSLENVASITIE